MFVKLSAAIFIRLQPNLDTASVSKLSRGFLILEFSIGVLNQKDIFKAQNDENTRYDV